MFANATNPQFNAGDGSVLPQKVLVEIASNYKESDCPLRGCLADAQMETDELQNHCGFLPEFTTMLTDKSRTKPTKANVLKVLEQAAKLSHAYAAVPDRPNQTFWVGMSSHGSRERDDDGDEQDGYDELFVPSDFEENGCICDDQFHDALKEFHPSCTVVVPIDACHSGTMGDLRHTFTGTMKVRVDNPRCDVRAAVYLVSGCRDNQTSADAYGLLSGPAAASYGKYTGAMKTMLWQTIRDNGYVLTFDALMKGTKSRLKAGGFDQVPVLSSTRVLTKHDLFLNCGPRRGVVC
jgi:hypothetical protein